MRASHQRTDVIVITDETLELIETEIADHEPERGGALLGPVGVDAISRFVPDPTASTTRSSYRSSPALGEMVRAIEEANPLLEFKGIIHSHPGTMDRPSSQDRIAFADSLELNPWMELFIAPIVVRHQPWRTLETPQGRLDLGDRGWLTMWEADRSSPSSVQGRSVRAMSLLGDLDRLSDLGLMRSEPPVLIEHEGAPVLAATVAAGPDCRFGGPLTCIVPWTYPNDPPLVIHGPEKGEPLALELTWNTGLAPADRLLAALTAVAPRRSDDAVADQEPCSTGRGEAGQTSELADMDSPSTAARANDELSDNELSAQFRSRLNGITSPSLSGRTVTVVGVGSVGSHLVELLVRAGVERITLVDPDTVEVANLSRCTFTMSDVGRPKVEVIGRRLQMINHRVTVDEHLLSVDDLGGTALGNLVAGSDLVVAATDDPSAQLRLNHHAFAAEVPAIYPAIYARGHGGEVVISVPGITPCFRCATAGRAHRDTRPDTDYGTGRLVAEPALGADILHVTTAAAKIATGLLNWSTAETDLDEFVAGALGSGSYMLLGMAPGFEFFDEVFGSTPAQFAFQSVWLQATSSPSCAVCGDEDDRVDPTKFDTTAPDLTQLRQNCSETLVTLCHKPIWRRLRRRERTREGEQ